MMPHSIEVDQIHSVMLVVKDLELYGCSISFEKYMFEISFDTQYLHRS
jgi:hypothetical protein